MSQESSTESRKQAQISLTWSEGSQAKASAGPATTATAATTVRQPAPATTVKQPAHSSTVRQPAPATTVKQPATPAPAPVEKTPAAPVEKKPAAPVEEAPKPATPEPESPAVEEKAESPAPSAPENPKPDKTGKGGIILDTLLVLVLLGGLGTGAWFVMKELDQYRVPSPLELAQNEHLELCKQHEQLQEAAYRADEQLHLQERIAGLEQQIATVKNQIATHKQAVQEAENCVHSLQREIRQEDRSSRAVARSLLIGLPIGNAATTNGKVYQDAVIHRLQEGKITLRFATGQATFPISRLVKDNLPDMVRYALGVDDMVDMSDFGHTPKRRKGKLITPRKASTQVSTAVSYEPEYSAPVVNTQSPSTISVEPGLIPGQDDSWDAPSAPLPIEE